MVFKISKSSSRDLSLPTKLCLLCLSKQHHPPETLYSKHQRNQKLYEFQWLSLDPCVMMVTEHFTPHLLSAKHDARSTTDTTSLTLLTAMLI